MKGDVFCSFLLQEMEREDGKKEREEGPESSSSSSNSGEPTVAAETEEEEEIVDPWTVSGGKNGIDYNKLVDKFGSKRIDDELLQRFEAVTGRKPHCWLRRGYFFSHRSVALSFSLCLRLLAPRFGADRRKGI